MCMCALRAFASVCLSIYYIYIYILTSLLYINWTMCMRLNVWVSLFKAVRHCKDEIQKWTRMWTEMSKRERERKKESTFAHTHTSSAFWLWQWVLYRMKCVCILFTFESNSVDARICVCGDLGSGSSTNTNAKKCRQTHNGFVHGTYVHTKIHHHLTTTASFNRHKTKNYASFLFHFVNIVVHLAAQAVAPTARWILKTFITAKDAGVWTLQS